MSTIEAPVWLDKKFLEESLRAGYDKTLTVAAYDVKMVTGKGENYSSTMYRVTIKTTGNRTFSVVIKHLLDVGTVGDVIQKSTVHLRETTMLSVVLPKMAALLQNAMPGEKIQPFGPQHIFSREGLIIMEDLLPLGLKMVKRHNGLDIAHCLLVMRQLGKFHATSVLVRQQDPDCMDIFQQSFYAEPINQEHLCKLLAGLLYNAADEVQTWPGSEQYAGKLRAIAKNVMGFMKEAMSRDDTAFNVLNHGDLWKNNMMFRYSNTGQPESVCFVDHQIGHYTSPACDLQNFIYTSPTDEVRMRHTDTMLKEYHSALCDTLTALGYSQKLITLKELQTEYDSKAILGVIYASTFLPLIQCEQDIGFDLDNLIEDRSSTTAVFRGAMFKSALQRMLPVFEKQGAFRQLD